MSSNYPPGVTGREYEIAGPDSEDDEEATCRYCEAHGWATILRYGGQAWFICEACGKQNDLDPETLMHAGPDPDALYDQRRDDAGSGL